MQTCLSGRHEAVRLWAPLWTLSGSADPTFRDKPVTKIKPCFRVTCGQWKWCKCKASAQKVWYLGAGCGPTGTRHKAAQDISAALSYNRKEGARAYLTEAPAETVADLFLLLSPLICPPPVSRGFLLDVALRMRAGPMQVRGVGVLTYAANKNATAPTRLVPLLFVQKSHGRAESAHVTVQRGGRK